MFHQKLHFPSSFIVLTFNIEKFEESAKCECPVWEETNLNCETLSDNKTIHTCVCKWSSLFPNVGVGCGCAFDTLSSAAMKTQSSFWLLLSCGCLLLPNDLSQGEPHHQNTTFQTCARTRKDCWSWWCSFLTSLCFVTVAAKLCFFCPLHSNSCNCSCCPTKSNNFLAEAIAIHLEEC